MKNKLVFRILGSLASALIIASVFIPFVSVTGYSQSLWETHSAVGTIYLPIMIIVFGVVGIIVFSTGFKTELAYASAGGLLFFLIMQTIPVIDQNLFNTLGVGYYSLVIGTLLIVVMAFICGLRVKQKVVEEVVVEEKKEESMIDQIDRLYNDQTSTQNLNENKNLDNIIQPLSSNELAPIPVALNTLSESEVENTAVELQNNSLENLNNNVEEVKPIPSFNNLETNVNVENQTVNEFSMLESEMKAPNLIGSELYTPEVSVPQEVSETNPVISEFVVPEMNVTQEVKVSNPVVSEFAVPEVNTANEVEASNPVVSEFSQDLSSQAMFVPSNNENLNQTSADPSLEQNSISSDSTIQPLASDKKVDVMADTTNTSSNLDIFG